MKILKRISLAFGMTVFVALPASATLIGHTVTAAYNYPNFGSDYGGVSFTQNPFVVGAGIESIGTVDGFAATSIDFSATSLQLAILNAVGYNSATMSGYAFTDLTSAFTGSVSAIASGGQSVSASISGGTLFVNWQGQSFSVGDTVTVSFASGVPEPSTWAMMVIGFAGLGYAGYRKRKATPIAA